MMKLLFYGGCHVGGYPITPNGGFTQTAVEILTDQGVEVSTTRVGWAKLNRPEKLRLAVEAVHPDILILQMGHFELTVSLTKELRAESSRSSRAPGESWTPPPPSSLIRKAALSLKAAVKLVIARTASRPLLDVDSVELEARQFFEAVAQLRVGRVLMLGPFPALDLCTLYVRRQAERAFRESADRFGFAYYDALHCPSLNSAGLSVFHDALHLSAEGHRRVGERVAEKLAHLISSSVPNRHQAA